ncbi:hypothetical protein [Staphylococcus warneri]|uniref:hypothetical protein n=1 Tax=Staphylococcus warneri TaxID=1292 RepID=UPI001A8DF7B1|nr:hypothetical protein [Staphylococcus warneri]MBO0377086.1 hypothetical protein [Staphylococcus warneri]
MIGNFITALALTLIIIGIIYISVRFNKRNRSKQSQLQTVPVENQQNKSRFDDTYHVGGITTEHFVLLLIETRSLSYGGYDFEVLQEKKTQTNYDGFSLYDCLYDIFENFDDILNLDYVEKGYGSMYSNGVEATYDSNIDVLRVKTYGVMLSGAIGEMRAFRDNPLGNVDMLDVVAASNNPYDYAGVITEKI